jgi:hypothetical protein
VIVIVVVLVLLVPVVMSAIEVVNSQRADYGWRPPAAPATYSGAHPVVVVDQAHNNASTAGIVGRYWPFAQLLRADGYVVRKGKTPFTRASLDAARVLVIVNASGAAKPQVLGINLPGGSDSQKDRGAPAFTAAEIHAVQDWVARGGSLLLIADHAPFGSASAAMARAFGVTLHCGFVEVPDEKSDPLLFSRENHRLGDHPILTGASAHAAVRRVETFTGESLDGPPGASVLLRLPANAIEYMPPPSGSGEFVPGQAGETQGVAFAYGQGRVVVLGEAAMLTAQVSRRVRFGMNSPGNDNRQFALNALHWLSRAL